MTDCWDATGAIRSIFVFSPCETTVLVLKIFIRVMPYLSEATMSRHVNDTVVFMEVAHG